MKKVVIALVIIFLLILLFVGRRYLTTKPPSKLKVYEFGDTSNGFICFIAGTHGNEPAGTVALEAMVKVGYFKEKARLLAEGHEPPSYDRLQPSPWSSHGRTVLPKGIKVIPRVNEWGLTNNNRYQNLMRTDINREYKPDSNNPIIKQVLAAVRGATLIVDFHEGWGFHACQPESLGSTLSPNNFEPAPKLATAAVETLNTIIKESCKKFTVLMNESCTIKNTLSCLMEQQHVPYILVETTGQNNIQRICLRANQIKKIIDIVIGV
jgi:hypothetical protein